MRLWLSALGASSLVVAGVVPAVAAPTPGPEAQVAGSGYRGMTVNSSARTSQALNAVAAPGGTLDGRDVSVYNAAQDWKALYASGVRFAVVRATAGLQTVDSAFSQHYTASRAAGLVRGAYHFARPDQYSTALKGDLTARGAEQADYFIAHGGGWIADGWTLPGALDLESASSATPCYSLTKAQLTTWIQGFSNRYRSRTGRYPMIYTNPSWWSQCVYQTGLTAFARNPLWVAHWQSQQTNGGVTPATPSVPGGWTKYSVWQYRSGSQEPGKIDRDAFAGNQAALVAFAKHYDRVSDLKVTVRIPAKIRRGHRATLTFTVTNSGPDTAANVTFDFRLPKKFTFHSVSGCKHYGSGIRCTWSSFTKHTVTIKLVVNVRRQRGKVVGTAKVWGAVQDPNGRNNTATFTRYTSA